MNTVLILTLLSTLAVPALAQQHEATSRSTADQEEAFVHTVYFWLSNKDSQSDHDKLYEGLKMISKIEHIEKAYIGVPADTDREVIDSSYDFSITFIFKNQEEEQAYQTHPTHLKFVEEYGPLWERVVVYDAVTPGE